jgi:PKD repeat protein
MKYIVLLLCLILLPFISNAQQIPGFENENLPSRPEQQNMGWYKDMQQERPNIFAAEQEFRHYKESLGESASQPASRQEREFMLWLARNRNNADAQGFLVQPMPDPRGIERFYNIRKNKPAVLQSILPWRPLGPFTWDKQARLATGSPGTGVIRTIAPHPTNQIVLAGTISAGIWRSTDGGNTWQETTRQLLCKYVGGIAWASENIVYAGTDAGVLKSTNAGATWNYTNLNKVATYPAGQNCDQVITPPGNPDIILANRGSQLMRSKDGGASWTAVQGWNNEIWSMNWHPVNKDIVYAAARTNNGKWVEIRRSTNAGLTWQNIQNGYPAPRNGYSIERAIIATTPAAPDYVYVLAGGSNGTNAGLYGLYISRDAAQNFQHLCCGNVDGPEPADEKNNPNIFDYSITGNNLGQITWDMGFAISSTDTNFMVGSGIFSYKSTDGGRSFQSTPPIHYDVQCVSIKADTVYVATDGGLYISRDRYTSIQFSDGINSLEIWGFDAAHKGNIMIAGAYHMPIMFRDDSVYDANGYEGGWYMWSGADAMGANVNPADTRWMYSKPWGNVRSFRYPDKQKTPWAAELGIDLGYITQTNLDYHPHNYYTIYGCDYNRKAFMISTDNGSRWDTLRVFTSNVSRLRASIANPLVLTGIADNAVWRSTDGGKKWQNITPQNERAGQGLNDIALGDTDDKKIWLSLGGFQDIKKVLYSDNGGQTWQDYSGTLPKAAIRTLCAQRGTNGGIYAATTMGVYYRNQNMSDWELHGREMPVGEISFLNINYEQGLIRAATERGIWENELYEPSAPKARISADRTIVTCYREPVRFADMSVWKRKPGSSIQWAFEGGIPAISTEENPQVIWNKKGIYSITLTVKEDGRSDTYTLRDFIEVKDNECGLQGIAGGALNMADSLDYISIPALPLKTNSITFMAWIKPNGIQKNWSPVIQSDIAAGFGFKNDKNELGYHWKNGANNAFNSGLIAQPGEWSHVAMTVMPDSVILFLNGQPSVHKIKCDSLDFSQAIIRIGQDRGWNQTRNFDGLIDEIRIYKRALSTAELRLRMHITGMQDSLLLCIYQCNEQKGNMIYDAANGYDAQINGKSQRIVSAAPVAAGSSSLDNIPQIKVRINNPAQEPYILLTNRLETGFIRPLPIYNAGSTTMPEWWLLRAWSINTAKELSLQPDTLAIYAGRLSSAYQAIPSRIHLYTSALSPEKALWDTCTASSADSALSLAMFTQCNGRLPAVYSIAKDADIPLQIEQAEKQNIQSLRLWPQPIYGSDAPLSIMLPRTIVPCTVHIYNMNGREVLNAAAQEDLLYLDISSIPAGVYTIRAGNFTARLFRQ